MNSSASALQLFIKINQMSHKFQKVGKNYKILPKIEEGSFGQIYQAINTETNFQVFEKVGNNYKILRKIDEGSFGKIYQAINTKTNFQVAIKFESVNCQHPQLIYQCKLLKYLNHDFSVMDKGLPNVYYCSTEGEYNVLVMDLMGPSLQSLFDRARRPFSLKTVLMLLDQMFNRIEYIHRRSFLHRDIKPDNLCMGLNRTAHKLYLIDFGLAKRYMQRDLNHIPYREGKHLTGTPCYASLNTHLGIQQSRRDDLESIAYVGVYLLRGVLPWQGLKANSRRDKYDRIKQKKMSIPVQQICYGCPEEFTTYLKCCRNLKFDQRPAYSYYKFLFKELLINSGFEYDYQYDWTLPQVKKEEEMQQMEVEEKRAGQLEIEEVKIEESEAEEMEVYEVKFEEMEADQVKLEEMEVDQVKLEEMEAEEMKAEGMEGVTDPF